MVSLWTKERGKLCAQMYCTLSKYSTHRARPDRLDVIVRTKKTERILKMVENSGVGCEKNRHIQPAFLRGFFFGCWSTQWAVSNPTVSAKIWLVDPIDNCDFLFWQCIKTRCLIILDQNPTTSMYWSFDQLYWNLMWNLSIHIYTLIEMSGQGLQRSF